MSLVPTRGTMTVSYVEKSEKKKIPVHQFFLLFVERRTDAASPNDCPNKTIALRPG